MKEYYFYLESTPTHSYMKYLYTYPQAAYSYADLQSGNHLQTMAGMVNLLDRSADRLARRSRISWKS